MPLIEVKVPDIGDFKDIPVIEVLVKPGDRVEKEDSLVTLESDKATQDLYRGELGGHAYFTLDSCRLRFFGGTTNHWGGWSLRFKPEDFELKSRTGMGADWPITYDDLAPHFVCSA